MMVTAEESGLLGAKYYENNTLYPLDKTVANINLDGINQWGKTSDFTVVGLGNSDLDDVLTDVEETEGTGVRIGVTNSNNFDTHVQPRSPDRSSDMPGPPPAADKSEPRQPV
jgi:Zn-dependent M28 family amino/carboxypeptidase